MITDKLLLYSTVAITTHFCIKLNLYYTRDTTPKRVTSGGAHLRGLASGLHSSEVTSQWWRVVGDTTNLTDPGFEPQTFRTDSVCAKQLSLTTWLVNLGFDVMRRFVALASRLSDRKNAQSFFFKKFV